MPWSGDRGRKSCCPHLSYLPCSPRRGGATVSILTQLEAVGAIGDKEVRQGSTR